MGWTAPDLSVEALEWSDTIQITGAIHDESDNDRT